MNVRLFAAASFAVLLSTPCFAQSDAREDALSAVAKCASLTDDHARLACYDAAVPKVKDALAAPAAPAPQVAQTQEQQESWFGLPDIFGGNGKAPQTTPQQFGNESLPTPPPPPPKPGEPAPPPPPPIIDSISATVTDWAIHPDRRFVVFLDNGQIWQQIPGDTSVAHFLKKGPNAVVIARGVFGSYNLKLNDTGMAFKVIRIK
jgi:hypothetical protein